MSPPLNWQRILSCSMVKTTLTAPTSRSQVPSGLRDRALSSAAGRAAASRTTSRVVEKVRRTARTPCDKGIASTPFRVTEELEEGERKIAEVRRAVKAEAAGGVPPGNTARGF